MLHNARLGVGCTIKHHDGPALCGEPDDGGGGLKFPERKRYVTLGCHTVVVFTT